MAWQKPGWQKRMLCAALLLCAAGAPLHVLAQSRVAGQRVPLAEVPLDVSEGLAASTTDAASNQRYLSGLTRLGSAIFHDTRLSASGKLACATCHDAAHAFSAPSQRAVQAGGARARAPGTRAVPSLQYLQTTPVFVEHFFEDEGAQAGQDAGPTGGLTWDGRVDNLHEQARIPLFAANEMATTPSRLVQRLRQAAYAQDFKTLFGDQVFDHPEQVIEKTLLALQTFQQDPALFYPYTSKYDAVLRGQATLSAQEARGLEVFNQTDKGNCASCHPSSKADNGGLPQFTDYGFAALGLPRNAKIPANARAGYFDKGLCGPVRTDLADHKEYCGLFKVPSLRNVAVKKVFYHNAAALDLESAVRFYAERDTQPAKWYPRNAKGRVQKFNDLPARYRDNIETDTPFGQQRGEKPAISPAEVKDIVAFLKTLTDGYAPGAGP